MAEPKTALVVEDSFVQATALADFLEQSGLRVLHAPNGRIGLVLAAHHKPDVIILDVKMPEMDGFETCRRLKQNELTAHIPIVMMTVQSQPGALLEGLEVGAIDFIPKDVFSHQVLHETLRHLNLLEDNGQAT